MNYTIPVKIELLEEGGYLAVCSAIPGCHAEGRSAGEALDHLRDVARVLYELSVDKGLVFYPEHPEAKPGSILWQVQIPLLASAG